MCEPAATCSVRRAPAAASPAAAPHRGVRVAAPNCAEVRQVVKYARSSGPGGQHVNKTESKVDMHSIKQAKTHQMYSSSLGIPEAFTPFVMYEHTVKSGIHYHIRRKNHSNEAHLRKSSLIACQYAGKKVPIPNLQSHKCQPVCCIIIIDL